MTKEELRKECARLFMCDTIADSIDLLDIYSEFLFNVIQTHHYQPEYTKPEADAKIVVQMMLTKVLHLKGVIQGISYTSKDGSTLNEIIDPTIVASLIRNIYETVGMFHLIYRHAQPNDERKILYLLWVHSGLKYRQRFASIITKVENKEKHEHEQKEMDKIVSDIKSTPLFKSLDEDNQKIIKKKIKDKDYHIRFDDKKDIQLHWQELTKVMGIKNGLLDNIYTYFCLYAHPSNVSVFQFADMFQKGSEDFPELVNFNLQIALKLLGIFVADYIHLFPPVLSTFEQLDLRDQIVINFYNKLGRGDEYSINDSWKACE